MSNDTRWKLCRDGLPPHEDITEVEVGRLFRCHPGSAEIRLRVLTLVSKLHEETGEIAEKPHDVSEYADLLEVAYTLAAEYGISPEQIEQERLRKRAERGGYDRMRLIVEDRRGPDSKPTLQQLLEQAARRPASDAELQAQRLSWARGEAGMGSDRDEAEYRQALRDGDKDKLARLDAQAQQRMDRVGKVTFEEK